VLVVQLASTSMPASVHVVVVVLLEEHPRSSNGPAIALAKKRNIAATIVRFMATSEHTSPLP
jgi:hypothetical protein